MAAQTRAHPRYAAEIDVELTHRGGKTLGRTRNLSKGGFCCDIQGGLALGTDCDISMSLVFDEDTFSEPLELPARIVWCTPVGDKFQLGASFLPMTSEQLSYLGMFLRYLEEGLSIQAELADEEAGNLSDPFQ